MKNSHDLVLRQLTMLRMIPKFPNKITASLIKAKLEDEGYCITKRTIERDLQSLSTTFPLISDEQSKPFGWSWSADAPAIDLPGLTTSEALTLKLAEQYLTKLMPTSMVQQLVPYFKAATQVLNTLEQNSNLAKWPDKIAVVLPTQPLLAPNINQAVNQKIEQALLQEKQLLLLYKNRSEQSPKQLTVHPIGIILRGQVNYLCATIYSYQDVVLLPIHRILEAEILDQQSNRPASFDLHTYANSGAMGFLNEGLSQVKIRISKEAGLHLYETRLSQDQVIIDEGETLLVEAKVTINKQFEWWLNGFGSSVRLIESIPVVNS